MSTVFEPQADRQSFSQPLDALLVVGSGNTMQGVSAETQANAFHASELIKLGAAQLVIAAGYGPNPNLAYPETEAEVMANIIRSKHPNLSVLQESRSTSTQQNVANIEELLYENEVSTIGVVAKEHHIDRLAFFMKKRYPDIQTTNFTTPLEVGGSKRLEQKILLGVARTAFIGSRPTGDSFRRHARAYSIGIAPLKFAALAGGNNVQYGIGK